MSSVTAEQTFLDPSELKQLLLNDSSKSKLMIIDVRGGWDGDFKGGNINGAANIPYQDLLHNKAWNSIIEHDIVEKDCENIVFHCMYSQVRGPASYDRFIVIKNEILEKYYANTNSDKQNENGQCSFCSCCCLSNESKQSESNDEYKIIELKNQQLSFKINDKIANALKKVKVSILKDGFYGWIESNIEYYETDLELFDKLVENYDALIWSAKSKRVMQQEKDKQQMQQNETIETINQKY